LADKNPASSKDHFFSGQVRRVIMFIHRCSKPHSPSQQTSFTVAANFIHRRSKPHSPTQQTSFIDAANLIHRCSKPHSPLHQTSFTAAANLIHRRSKWSYYHEGVSIKQQPILKLNIKSKYAEHVTFL